MNEFKMGQEVWSWNWGWGVVRDFDPDSDYSVLVEYGENGENHCWYTSAGAEYDGGQRTLFFKEIPIPADALVPPVEEITLNQGDIVLMKNGQLRYVAAHSGNANKLFTCHDCVPQDLDSAFNYSTAFKEHIKKFIGNINV